MENRPTFWNEETQDINDYWYNRISAFAYPLIGGTILVHQASQIIKEKPIAPDGVNPLFIAIAGYMIYKTIRCAINISKEKKGELEQKLD